MTSSPIDVTQQDRIFHIRLNRPEAGNAANPAMVRHLLHAIQLARESAGVRVVLITAAGNAFMAGGDLDVLSGDSEQLMALVDGLSQAILALAQCDVPVVCAVQGLAAGGGLGLALAGDLLIAEEGARFTVGGPAMGLSPDGGTSWHLARWVGARKALEMSLLCPTLDAQTALACGLISEIAPKGELPELAWKRARQLAAGAHVALVETKKLLRTAQSNDLPAQLALERMAIARCVDNPDFTEGLAALRGRRKARFGQG